MPPAAPLAMPRARRHGRRQPLRQRRRLTWRSIGTALSRLFVLTATAAIAAYGIHEVHGVTSAGGVTWLEWIFVSLFAVNFSWVAFAAAQALLGTVVMMAARLRQGFAGRSQRMGREAAIGRAGWGATTPGTLRTAVLVPVYEEDMVPVLANVQAMAAELGHAAPEQFAVFVLSDTQRVDAWLDEASLVRRLVASAPAGCPIYYRRRSDNGERKAGNVADWVECHGAGWDAMIVLDADSLMSAQCIRELAARLGQAPHLALIQSLPEVVNGESLYARLQQFAGACYGGGYAHGLAAWHGVSGNYWGHNAIIRVEAFAQACRLPVLPGRAPLGGAILSHDFIEAALLRRDGWGVRFDPDVTGSYEETPPSLVDAMIRDRRWCQGNLQHLSMLWARGLTFVSRLHLLTGIYAYLSAVVWMLMVFTGLGLALQVKLVPPDYFAELSLFPTWPVFDTQRAIRLLVTTLVVVLSPKLLGYAGILLDPGRWRGFAGPLNTLGSVLWEAVMSALYAPLLMVAQCRTVLAVLAGRDASWRPQRRADGGQSLGSLIRVHGWDMLLGLALSALAFALEPDVFFWLLPFTAGLVLAVPLSWLSSSRRLGRWCRWAGLGLVPSETSAEPVLARARALRGAWRAESAPDAARSPVGDAALGPLRRLAEDRAFAAWHLAQQTPPPADVRSWPEPLLTALAKADLAGDLATLDDWLTPEQQRALLGHPPYLARLIAARGERQAS